MVSTNEVHNIFRKLKGNSFTDKEMRAYRGHFTRNQIVRARIRTRNLDSNS